MITEQMKREVLGYMGYTDIQPLDGDTDWSCYLPEYGNIRLLVTIDLNFLFEVARKIDVWYLEIDFPNNTIKKHYATVDIQNQRKFHQKKGNTPAEALFLALYQAIKELK